MNEEYRKPDGTEKAAEVITSKGEKSLEQEYESIRGIINMKKTRSMGC